MNRLHRVFSRYCALGTPMFPKKDRHNTTDVFQRMSFHFCWHVVDFPLFTFFSFLFPFLSLQLFVCLCVCVRAWVCAWACMYARMRVYVCMFARVVSWYLKEYCHNNNNNVHLSCIYSSLHFHRPCKSHYNDQYQHIPPKIPPPHPSQFFF